MSYADLPELDNFIEATNDALSYSAAHPDQHESIEEMLWKAVLAARLTLGALGYVDSMDFHDHEEEQGENDDSPEEREMTRQGVGDFGDELPRGSRVDAHIAACARAAADLTMTSAVYGSTGVAL